MRELNSNDKAMVYKRIPSKIRKLLKENHDKLFLAGGFIRSCVTGDDINDIDIFCNPEVAKEIVEDINSGEEEYISIKTKNAYTIRKYCKYPIQFVHRWEANNELDVINCFDFTICQAVVWFNSFGDFKSMCVDSFYEDIAGKRLEYTRPVREEEAGGSLIRVLKYYSKGYKIPLDSLAAVIANFTVSFDWGLIVKRQLEEDKFYVEKIAHGLLREVDPNTLPRTVTVIEDVFWDEDNINEIQGGEDV
jgi:hypothetical protein